MGAAIHRVAVVGCLWACNCWFLPPGPEDPFEDDCIGCEEFELDPTCELPGELTVQIGQGANGYQTLSDGEEPDYYLGPQGGGHYFFAVRVGNVDPSRYDMLEVTLDGYFAEECPDDGEACGTGHRRTVVLGGDEGLPLVGEQAQEHGILMALDGESVVQVVVRDPCGREGWTQHRW